MKIYWSLFYRIIFVLLLGSNLLCSSVGAQTALKAKSMFIDCSNNKSMKQLKNTEELKEITILHANNLNKSADFKEIIKRIYDFSNLNTLIISNSNLKSWPNEIADMIFLEELIVIDCEELNLKTTFKQMQALPIFSKLRLTRNNIEYLPKEIGLLKKLETISISKNRNLDVNDAIDKLQELPKLTSLGLPVNQIIEIPSNIGKLKYLEELDIRDNNLTDLPDEIGNLYDLETLNIEKNILVNPVGTLKKLSGINLIYLSVDADLTAEELEQIRTIFPEAEIEEVMEEDMDSFDFNISEEDINQAELADTAVPIKKPNAGITTTFTKANSTIKIHSLGYLHYADFFDKLVYTYNFDTTSFDARFSNKKYRGTSPLDTVNPFNNLGGLHMYNTRKNKTDEIRFSLVSDGFGPTRYFPELGAFRGMYWVLDQSNFTKKTFNKELIGKNLFRSSSKLYNDLRISYMPHKKTFNIQIKGEDSTYTLEAHPKSFNGNKDADLKTYEKRFGKYLKELDKRRIMFHRGMYRSSKMFKRSIITSKLKAWSDFRKIYLSPDERKMKKQDWLDYYSDVLSDEEEALRNSKVDLPYLDRWMSLNQFRNQSEYNEKIKDSSTRMGLFTFRDQDGKNLIVTQLLVIDKTEKEYAYYRGSTGLKEIILY
ncbi:MAG: leucine-rich repeat domain-containing protein, partial [Flavobacteriales bacterium]|nr:leucine-rich repeat domain-containing protein [Flavobacteriales bacterium]